MLSVITPTANCPLAFAFCEEYLSRQTYGGAWEWIVADGGSVPVECTMGQVHLRTGAPARPRENFRANLLAAFEAAKGDALIICEHDDVYHPEYLSLMAGLLVLRPLVGAAFARYYNVRARMWRIHPNNQHASLCQTGFRRELLPTVIDKLRSDPNPHMLDGHIWRRSGIPAAKKLLLPSSDHVVGIKGLHGSKGLGCDHVPADLLAGKTSGGVFRYTRDPELEQLRAWIGSDADRYASYYAGAL